MRAFPVPFLVMFGWHAVLLVEDHIQDQVLFVFYTLHADFQKWKGWVMLDSSVTWLWGYRLDAPHCLVYLFYCFPRVDVQKYLVLSGLSWMILAVGPMAFDFLYLIVIEG